MQAIVIGGGVVGASVAYRLARGGASVVVFERHRVGGGTSGTSFAWANANEKSPRAYHDLNAAGIRAHAALRDEFPDAPWWHGGGCIEWADADGQAALHAKVERLRAWDYPAEWITQRELAELEPDIDLALVGGAPVAYFPEDSWLDPVLYAHAMLIASGARIVLGQDVTRIRSEQGRATGVVTADGTLHPADIVVNCAGRWADEPDAGDSPRLPLAPTIGFLVLTPPVATALRRVVRNPVCNLRPDGAGRLMLHRDETDAQFSVFRDPGPDSLEARDMTARASRVLPCIGPVEPEATRMAIRPIPRDGRSAIGPMPGVAGYYVVVTHSGVTLSAFLGQAIADEILTGNERPELAAFRPARLFN